VDAEVASGTDSWMLVASGTNSGLPRLLVEPFKVVGADGTLHGCQQNAPHFHFNNNTIRPMHSRSVPTNKGKTFLRLSHSPAKPDMENPLVVVVSVYTVIGQPTK
jgi:hypothetical protein